MVLSSEALTFEYGQMLLFEQNGNNLLAISSTNAFFDFSFFISFLHFDNWSDSTGIEINSFDFHFFQ